MVECREHCMPSWAGTDAARISKSIKIAKRLVLHTIETPPSAMAKPELSSNVILSKRKSYSNHLV